MEHQTQLLHRSQGPHLETPQTLVAQYQMRMILILPLNHLCGDILVLHILNNPTVKQQKLTVSTKQKQTVSIQEGCCKNALKKAHAQRALTKAGQG
eukprot:959780-Amphidinium_carterae.1